MNACILATCSHYSDVACNAAAWNIGRLSWSNNVVQDAVQAKARVLVIILMSQLESEIGLQFSILVLSLPVFGSRVMHA
jgi:hypothetical protein